jgi:serine protease inhibitor ecotin
MQLKSTSNAARSIGLLMITLAIGPALISIAQASETSRQAIKSYPASPKGYQRFVLHLEPLDNEVGQKLDIVSKKTVTDTCGLALRTRYETRTDPAGTYYVLSAQFPRKNIACMETVNGELVRKRTPGVIGGKHFTIPYTSSQPIVVFVPAGIEPWVWSPTDNKPMERNEADPSQRRKAKPAKPILNPLAFREN